MKLLLLLALSVFSAQVYACQCSKETLDEWKPIHNYIKENYGVTVDMEKDIKCSAYSSQNSRAFIEL